MGLSLWGGAAVAASYMTLLPYTFTPAAGRYARGFLALCSALCPVLGFAVGFVLWWRVGGFSADPFANCKKGVLYLRAPFFSTYKRMRTIHRMNGRRKRYGTHGG